MLKRICSKFNNLYYRFLTRSVTRLHLSLEELRASGFSSQCGQDKWVAEVLCKGVVSGVFVDIGANDGVSFSNTFYLEQKRGWTGLAVEPIPEVYEKLSANRLCQTVNGCVGAQSGKAMFQVVSGYAEMLSGLIDEYVPQHQKRIQDEIAEYGGMCHEIETDCFTFNELVEKYDIRHIDYLNIDTEGAEYSILKSIDFSRVHISVVGIENNYADSRFPTLMKKMGFRLHSIVGDEFYLNQ